MVNKIILFIFLFTSPLFADCRNTNDLSETKIKNIKIEFNKEKKFITKVSKLYISHKKGAKFSKKSANKNYFRIADDTNKTRNVKKNGH